MGDSKSAVVSFWELCRTSPWVRAAAAGIPAIGPSLVLLMAAKDQTELLSDFEGLAADLKLQLLDQIATLSRTSSPGVRPIIAVGSGNEEYVLVCPDEVVLGQKHPVEAAQRYGGSCVNYALRLLTCGVPVLPIASIGNDKSGHRIRDHFLSVARQHCPTDEVLQFIGSDAFFAPGVHTPHTTVLVHGPHRTIFSQRPDGADSFANTLESRLEAAEGILGAPPGAVLLGHIYGDQPNDDHVDCHEPGECTRFLVDRYSGRACVVVNFGQSQIERGADSWQQMLRQVDVLQLNLDEMRRFLAGGGRKRSLKHIVQWLAERAVTAVVTLDRLGALGTYKDGKHGTVFAWSLITSDDVTDPTGAGDAFAAGMVSQLQGHANPTFFEFRQAMAAGRLWAAYACTTVAGPKAHPTPELLAEFASDLEQRREYRPVEELHGYRAEEVLDLFDMAYH